MEERIEISNGVVRLFPGGQVLNIRYYQYNTAFYSTSSTMYRLNNVSNSIVMLLDLLLRKENKVSKFNRNLLLKRIKEYEKLLNKAKKEMEVNNEKTRRAHGSYSPGGGF